MATGDSGQPSLSRSSVGAIKFHCTRNLEFCSPLASITNDIVSCNTLNSGFQHFITTNPTPTPSQNLQTLRRRARCKWGQLPAPICAYRLFDFVLHIQLQIAIICNVKYVHVTALNQTITSQSLLITHNLCFACFIRISHQSKCAFFPQFDEQLLEDLREENLRFEKFPKLKY